MALLCLNFSLSQTTIGIQDFDGGVPTMTYTGGTVTTGTGPFPATVNYSSASNGLYVNNSSEFIEFSSIDASSYTNINLTLRLASFAGTSGNGADGSDYVVVSISTDGGATYSDELEINGNNNAKWGFSGANAGTGTATTVYDGDNTPTNFTPTAGGYRTTDGYTFLSITNLPNSTNLRIRVELFNNSGNEYWIIDDILVEGTSGSPTPTLTVSPSSLTGLDYVVGSGPSAEQTFDVTGSLLTGDITITAPTDFEVSLTSGSGFSGSLIIPSASANSTNTIYIRLASGLAINTYTGNIDVSSTGATSRTVSVTGDVTAAPPSNDLCSGAISLTPTTSCSYTTCTNLNATDSGVADPSCASYNGGDVWFSVVVPASGEITVDTNNIGFTDSGMAMYTGSCGSLTLLECDDDDSPNGAMSSITQTGLSVGSTVYIRVWEYGGNASGDFGICVTAPAPPSTTLDFSSATYSIDEDGTSINLCVDISAPSSSVATTADVILVSTDSPHLTYSTTSITFPAGSSAQQCVSVAITDNSVCGDGNTYSFEIQNVSGGDSASLGTIDSTTLTVNDNEGTSGTQFIQTFSSGSTWNYTESSEGDEGTFGIVSTLSNIDYSGITGDFWGINDTNEEDSIIFDTVNTSGLTNMIFSFDYDVFEFDDNDDMYYELYFDGISQGKIQFINGFSNFSDEGTITVSIPDGTNSVAATLYVDQNGGGDYAAWDNVTITGDSCPACTPTHTITSFSPTSGPIGTTVTITGTGFTSGSTVDFNGISATVTFVNATTLTAVVPSGATTGVITVTESGCPIDSATDFTLTACTPSHSVFNFTPTSGPELTEVTITGTGFTASTTVDFNGTSATIISQTATQIIAEVPAGATSGTLTVTESGCALDISPDFTVIYSNNCSLAGSMPAGWTDLLISGVYDDSVSSCHYIELLNPTTSDIDLADYTIGFDNNFTLGSAVPITGFNGTVPLSGTIQAESSYMIQVTTISGGCSSCPTITPDYTYIGSNGLNDEDRLVLVQNYGAGSATAQDVWQNHSNGAGYNVGYVFARDFASTAPSSTFSNSDWVMSDTEDCFGFAISGTTPPSVTVQPSDVLGCNSATFNVTATPGNSGALTYQWLYNDSASIGWSNVTAAAFSSGTVTGESSSSLSISGFDLTNYQFYCKVIEDGVCSVSSDAAQFKGSATTTWSAGSWDNGIPDLTTTAIINDTYNTTSNGNIEACSLYINPSYVLTVGANSYVKVQTSIYNNGELLVQNEGSVIQLDNSGIYDDSGSVATIPTTVEKLTAVLDAWYEYTYWSSPVTNETIGSALFPSSPYRRFSFNAGNFVDSTYETNNNNATVVGAGVDDIDDDANDWQLRSAGDLMTPGVGYAATHSPAAYTTATNYNYSFRGPLNTGIISVSVERNDTELGDTNWNLIGNPYPSAIDATLFFNENNYSANPSTGTLDGAIYLWSHSTPPSATNNGNQQINFDLNDYITLNYTGSSVSGVTNYIASGQGFFVTYSDAAPSTTGTVTFNNSMRVDGNNNQFFRTSNINANTNSSENKLWLKLTNDFGLKDNIMIGYVNGATAVNDGAAYDAKTNGAYTKTMTFYSLIPGDSEKLSVQGKAITDLNINETIYIGFLNKIDMPTVYTISIDNFEGDFLANNTAYIKDNLLNTYHDLSASAYSFTSEVGEFNDRFEIVFTNPTLSIDQFTLNEINTTIISLTNDDVKFIAPKNLSISSVTIYDNLGRKIINLKGSEQIETYHLNTLSQSVYLAEIELSNKQKIIKKFIKN